MKEQVDGLVWWTESCVPSTSNCIFPDVKARKEILQFASDVLSTFHCDAEQLSYPDDHKDFPLQTTELHTNTKYCLQNIEVFTHTYTRAHNIHRVVITFSFS